MADTHLNFGLTDEEHLLAKDIKKSDEVKQLA